jgi:hypothetical protein
LSCKISAEVMILCPHVHSGLFGCNCSMIGNSVGLDVMKKGGIGEGG